MNKLKFRVRFSKRGIILICLTLLVASFGCLMVYSASFYSAELKLGNKNYYLIKQVVGTAIGFVGMIIFSQINYHILIKLRWVLVILSFVLLALVFIPGIGVTSYGASRWISLGGFTIQPSEIAKFAFILWSAFYLSKSYNTIKKFQKFLPIIVLGAIYCLLIILEPNMSITMCVGLVMLIMLFVGGISKKQFAFIGVPACLSVPALILLEPYRMKRFTAFLNPWASPQAEGFQLIQSLYCLGSGGWFGVGLFNSRQKYLYLPFAESDFIFSIICEEFGFVGGIILMLAFLTIIILIAKIAVNARDRFGCLLAVGVASIIAVQVLINIAVVSGSIPPTGLPLPLISSGSTSLVVFMSAIGICANISSNSVLTREQELA